MSRRSVLMEAVAATPRDLARMLRPVDAEVALRRPAPDAWRIQDVVAHLIAVDLIYLPRWQRIVREDNPYERAVFPDASAHDLTRPLPELLAEFTAGRGAVIAFLAGLDQRDWGRPFVHETLGPSRLRDQVQALVAHDNEHLNQIVELRESIFTMAQRAPTQRAQRNE